MSTQTCTMSSRTNKKVIEDGDDDDAPTVDDVDVTETEEKSYDRNKDLEDLRTGKRRNRIVEKGMQIQDDSRKHFVWLFRIGLIANGLVDIFLLGIFPLLAAVKYMPQVDVGITVQTLFPAFMEGGLVERLACYGFIACGGSRLISGLALINGRSKVADAVAAGTYATELLMLLLESELFKTTPPTNPVLAGIVICILTTAFLILGTQLRDSLADEQRFKQLDMKNETTNSLLRYWMIFNGLVIDIFMLGLIPLLASTQLLPVGVKRAAVLPLTVQSIFPSFVVGGLEERLCLYCFIACGCCRFGAGMGKFFGCNRSADIVAMFSYAVEVLMVLMEFVVFKTTTFDLVLPALVICPACISALLIGQLQTYTLDGLYKNKNEKKAKAD